MAIVNINDDELRQQIFENSCVIVKYHTENCPICKQLTPVYERLSEDPQYKGIEFIRMNADENPVAKMFVKEQNIPFVAIYKDGLLLECRTLETEEQLRSILNRLKRAQANDLKV